MEFRPRQCATSALDVDHIHTYPAGTVGNVQHSEGSVEFAKFPGPLERGADYGWSITYERSGIVMTHKCAPVARMSVLRVRKLPRHTSVSFPWGEAGGGGGAFMLCSPGGLGKPAHAAGYYSSEAGSRHGDAAPFNRRDAAVEFP